MFCLYFLFDIICLYCTSFYSTQNCHRFVCKHLSWVYIIQNITYKCLDSWWANLNMSLAQFRFCLFSCWLHSVGLSMYSSIHWRLSVFQYIWTAHFIAVSIFSRLSSFLSSSFFRRRISRRKILTGRYGQPEGRNVYHYIILNERLVSQV